MIKTLSFRSVLGFGLAVLFTQAVNANDGLSPEEANNLKDYTGSMTLDQLQADPEYKSILQETRKAAQETSKEEQQAVCMDVVEYQA